MKKLTIEIELNNTSKVEDIETEIIEFLSTHYDLWTHTKTIHNHIQEETNYCVEAL